MPVTYPLISQSQWQVLAVPRSSTREIERLFSPKETLVLGFSESENGTNQSLIKKSMYLYFQYSMNFRMAIRSALPGIFENGNGPPGGLLIMRFR